MIHITLLVLKILGIILASVLGLLVALVLIVLFVPIRYKLQAAYEEDLTAAARITWILRIISFTAEYGKKDVLPLSQPEGESSWNMNFRMKLKIFGKIIFDSSDSDEEEVKAQEKKSSFSLFKKRDSISAAKKTEKENKRQQVIQAETKTVELNPPIAKTIVEEKVESASLSKADISKEIKSAVNINTDTNIRKENIRITKAIAEAVPVIETNEKRSKGVVGFIRNIGARIKAIRNKLRTLFENIKKKGKDINSVIANLQEKYRLIRLFFQDEANKSALKYGFNKVKHLLKHIRPRKVRVYAEFGTGDPCSTGQLLGAAAIFMGAYGNSVKIIPDFENTIFKGNFYCRGRIQVIVILILGIKVICNKNIKALIKSFQTLKEEF